MGDEEIIAAYDSMNFLIIDAQGILTLIEEAVGILDEVINALGVDSTYQGKAYEDLDRFNIQMRQFIVQEAMLVELGKKYISLCLEKSKEEDAYIRTVINSINKVKASKLCEE